jgi:hypothetical protein
VQSSEEWSGHLVSLQDQYELVGTDCHCARGSYVCMLLPKYMHTAAWIQRGWVCARTLTNSATVITLHRIDQRLASVFGSVEENLPKRQSESILRSRVVLKQRLRCTKRKVVSLPPRRKW